MVQSTFGIKKRPVSAGADKHMLIRDEIVTQSLEEAMASLGMNPDQEIPQSPSTYKTGVARNMQIDDCLIEVAAHIMGAYYKANGIEFSPAMTSKSERVKEKMGITL